MVEGSAEENNGYSTMAVFSDGTIRITGFRKQKNYVWSKMNLEQHFHSQRFANDYQLVNGYMSNPALTRDMAPSRRP
jgi:hypothetical protein